MYMIYYEQITSFRNHYSFVISKRVKLKYWLHDTHYYYSRQEFWRLWKHYQFDKFRQSKSRAFKKTLSKRYWRCSIRNLRITELDVEFWITHRHLWKIGPLCILHTNSTKIPTTPNLAVVYQGRGTQKHAKQKA